MELPEDLQRVAARYGGAPVVRRRYAESSARVEALQRVAPGHIGSVGLVWNDGGQVVLVRPDPAVWNVEWVAPGGMAEPGEAPEETFVREVGEETGLPLARILDLTCVYRMTVTDGDRTVRGFLFQFEGLAGAGDLRPSGEIVEARWFDALPETMAFREDYVEPFRRRRAAVSR